MYIEYYIHEVDTIKKNNKNNKNKKKKKRREKKYALYGGEQNAVKTSIRWLTIVCVSSGEVFRVFV